MSSNSARKKTRAAQAAVTEPAPVEELFSVPQVAAEARVPDYVDPAADDHVIEQQLKQKEEKKVPSTQPLVDAAPETRFTTVGAPFSPGIRTGPEPVPTKLRRPAFDLEEYRRQQLERAMEESTRVKESVTLSDAIEDASSIGEFLHDAGDTMVIYGAIIALVGYGLRSLF